MFELETSRGRLAFALPFTITTTAPSTAHGEEVVEVKVKDEVIPEEPIGPVGSSVATAAGISGLALTLAYGLALKKIIAAKHKLREGLFRQRTDLDVQVGQEVKALFERIWENERKEEAETETQTDKKSYRTSSVDSYTMFDVPPGLSKEWRDLSAKFVQLFRVDIDGVRLPGMVGPTQGLAGYWQDIGHRRYSEIMNFGAKMLRDEAYGIKDIESWLDLREVFFRRLTFPWMRRYSASDLYRTLAKKHERIARRERHGTRVHEYEIVLVRSLHLVAAAMLWRMHADYLDKWKSKMMALTLAKMDIDRAIVLLKNVQSEKSAFWGEKGVRPLDDLQEHTLELRNRINMDMRVSMKPPPPPDDEGISRSKNGRVERTTVVRGDPTAPQDMNAMVPVSCGALSFAGVAISTLTFFPII